MRKQAIIALSILLAFAFGIFIWHILFPRRFNGKTEREWIRSLDPPSTPNVQLQIAAWQESEKAWRKLGSNAVPILLDALQMKAGPVQKVYSNLWSKLPSSQQKHLPTPLNYSNTRSSAASMLSAVARKQKIPLEPLVGAMEDDNWVTRMGVLALLNNFILKKPPADKEKIFPAVLRAAQDNQREVRMSAACALQYFPEHKATIIPVLKKFLFDESDPDVRIRAVLALYELDPMMAEKAGAAVVAGECMNSKGPFGARWLAGDFLEELARTSDAAMAVLRDNLFSSDSSTRGLAAVHLGKIGPRARSAVPALSRVCREDKDPVVRSAAQDALDKIAPEEAAKLAEPH